MSLLSDAKLALRITSTAYDDEVSSLISAAIDDLKGAGVTGEAAGAESPLVHRAIMTYVKANFGWGNEDYDRLMKAYDMQKIHLTLDTDYAYYAVTFTVLAAGVALREASVTLDGETLITGEAGTVAFKKRAGNNYTYEVTAEGYTADTDNLVDVVDGAVSITVTLGVA